MVRLKSLTDLAPVYGLRADPAPERGRVDAQSHVPDRPTRESGYGHGLMERRGGPPFPEQRVQVRFRDPDGTYYSPFPCRYTGGRWHNAETGEKLDLGHGPEATRVTGWRPWKGRD